MVVVGAAAGETRPHSPSFAAMSDFDEFERQLNENKQGEWEEVGGEFMGLRGKKEEAA